MPDDRPSKTAKKREYAELRALGESLIDLDEATLKKLPIDEALFDAVVAARSMTAHGALRRQKQLIGKRMAGIDASALRVALDALRAAGASEKRLFAAAERWRDRVLADGDTAIPEFAAEFGPADDRQLENLHGEWQRARSDRDEKRLRRSIFRHIHGVLVAHSQDGKISR